MAKGFNTHQERQMALSSFGKDLARRSKSKCELSGASGVSLQIYEIPPTKNDPEFDRCLMLSEDVIEQLENPKKLRPDEWRHLNELVWSEIPAVQIMTIRLLQHISNDQAWAQEILSEAYVDEEVMQLANAEKL